MEGLLTEEGESHLGVLADLEDQEDPADATDHHPTWGPMTEGQIRESTDLPLLLQSGVVYGTDLQSAEESQYRQLSTGKDFSCLIYPDIFSARPKPANQSLTTEMTTIGIPSHLASVTGQDNSDLAEFVENDEDGISRSFTYHPATSVKFQTARQRVQILDTVAFGRTLFLDGVLQSSVRDEAIYHSNLVLSALRGIYGPLTLKTVCILGGGEGATAREVFRCPLVGRRTIERVTMIDWDEELVDYFKKNGSEWHQGVFSNPNLTVLHEDVFTMKPPVEPYDAVIVDLVDPDWNDPQWPALIRSLATEWTAPGGKLVVNAGGVYPWDMSAATRIQTLLEPLCAGGESCCDTVFVPSFGREWAFVSCVVDFENSSTGLIRPQPISSPLVKLNDIAISLNS